MQIAYTFLPFATGIVILMTGLIVKIYQPKNRLALIFMGLCLSVFIWTLGYSINYAIASTESAIWACRAAFVGVVFIPATTIHFVLRFLKVKKSLMCVAWAAYVISLAFIPWLPTQAFLEKAQPMFWGNYPVAGPVYKFFVFYYGISFVGCLSMLFHSYYSQRSKQVKFVLIAFFIAAWSLVDYLPNYGFAIYPSAYICALLWILIIGYAICRHRLFDLEAIVNIVYRDRLMMLGLLSVMLPFKQGKN